MSKCPFSFLSFFKRKREITFYCKIKYGASAFPIEEGRNVSREWVEVVKKWFVDFFKKSHPAQRATSAHRCPGITGIMDLGFVVRAHRDFNIETVGDGETIKFWDCDELPPQLKRDTGVFRAEMLGNHLGKGLPKGALRSFVKIYAPWYFTVPKDVQFLVMDVPWKDDNRFQTVPGIFDPLYSNELTFIFYWFVEKGIETIKRGTPLAQIIPISKKLPYDSWQMKDMTNDMLHKFDMCNFAIASSKIANYPKIAEVSKKLFDL